MLNGLPMSRTSKSQRWLLFLGVTTWPCKTCNAQFLNLVFKTSKKQTEKSYLTHASLWPKTVSHTGVQPITRAMCTVTIDSCLIRVIDSRVFKMKTWRRSFQTAGPTDEGLSPNDSVLKTHQDTWLMTWPMKVFAIVFVKLSYSIFHNMVSSHFNSNDTHVIFFSFFIEKRF